METRALDILAAAVAEKAEEEEEEESYSSSNNSKGEGCFEESMRRLEACSQRTAMTREYIARINPMNGSTGGGVVVKSRKKRRRISTRRTSLNSPSPALSSASSSASSSLSETLDFSAAVTANLRKSKKVNSTKLSKGKGKKSKRTSGLQEITDEKDRSYISANGILPTSMMFRNSVSRAPSMSHCSVVNSIFQELSSTSQRSLTLTEIKNASRRKAYGNSPSFPSSPTTAPIASFLRRSSWGSGTPTQFSSFSTSQQIKVGGSHGALPSLPPSSFILAEDT